MYIFIKNFFLIIILWSVFACERPRFQKVIFLEVLGTQSHITVFVSPEDETALKRDIRIFILGKNRIFSRYLPDSELSLLNQAAKVKEVSPELFSVLEKSQGISNITPVFDVTVLPLVKIWDFKKGIVPDEKTIAQAKAQTGFQYLKLESPGRVIKEKPLQIDLGGVAKGHIIDETRKFLQAKGFDKGIVEIGGDLCVFGEKNWRVGIIDPRDKKPLYAFNLKNAALVTSGDYERFFKKNGIIYSHIIDPRTGRPVEVKAHSVSVIGPDAALADGLATAFFILGPEETFKIIHKFPGYHALFILPDGNSVKSPGFPYELERLKN